MGFDIPALEIVFGKMLTLLTHDTLVMTRTIWPDRRDRDFKLFRSGKLPAKLIGSHSLEAWGHRIGEYKGDFGKHNDWSVFTDEMLQYCRQDVVVNKKLYENIMGMNYSEDALNLEHEIHQLLLWQEWDGFPFDEREAEKLFSKLNGRRTEIQNELAERQPPWVHEEEFIPKVNNSKLGYEKGVPVIKKSVIEFNPSSREHIARMLIEKYDWKPKVFTDTGQAKVDEKVLSSLKYPEAELLNEYLMIEKRIGQLAEGKQAWMKLSKNGVIHGNVNHMGAVTSRCTHKNPNTAQIPSVTAPYGKESVVLYFTLLLIGLFVGLTFLVLSCVAWVILFLLTMVANTLTLLSMEISIQPINKPLGFLPATWLRPLSMAGFMEQGQRKLVRLLEKVLKKVRDSSESF